LQDAVQGFHWNNQQATIHPFVVYYNTPNYSLQHLSFVVKSDCLQHDTVSVHYFQKELISFLKQKFAVKKIYYFSDGAAAQYKNRKNFLNLAHHQEDFYIEAEWHFFGTSHGKGPCDGVGDTVKRLAARASLQKPIINQIQTSLQLFTWAEENISAVNFSFASAIEIDKHRLFLQKRFDKSVKFLVHKNSIAFKR